jgi:hypothetical protein
MVWGCYWKFIDKDKPIIVIPEEPESGVGTFWLLAMTIEKARTIERISSPRE